MIPANSTKGNNFCVFLFAFLDNIPSRKGTTLKGKKEQIVSFKSRPLSKREANLLIAEVLP